MKITVSYKNWRGVTSTRNIIPNYIYYGSTEYHPEDQYLLKAYDLDRRENRLFAFKDFDWNTAIYHDKDIYTGVQINE